jgi:RHS repeat-associated protein
MKRQSAKAQIIRIIFCEGKVSNFLKTFRFLRTRRRHGCKSFLRLFLSGLLISFLSICLTAQNVKNSDNKADKNIKSVAKINPSTLAMEFSIPLMSFPGRGGNGLPVAIRYSSKLWRIQANSVWWDNTPYNAVRYHTETTPMYAERSAAGWTSSLRPPHMVENLELYNQLGEPISRLLSESQLNGLNTNQSNVMEACSRACVLQIPTDAGTWQCLQWGQWSCTPIGGCPSNEACGGDWGPNGGNPVPPPPPLPYYIKRVRIEMPDGSSHEFRKDDAIHPYCATAADMRCNGTILADKTGTFLAVDGSGMRLERQASYEGQTRDILYLPNGSQYIFAIAPSGGTLSATYTPAEKYIDVDGNQSLFNPATQTWTDTMGREITDILPENWTTQSQEVRTQDVLLPGLAGENREYKLVWKKLEDVFDESLPVEERQLNYAGRERCNTNAFNPVSPALFTEAEQNTRICTYEPANNASLGKFNPTVLSEVRLPNEKSYAFKYNRFGEITRIDYPTGGYETFTYSKIPSLGETGSSTYDQTNRGVVERKVYSGGEVIERQQYSAGYTPFPNSTYVITTKMPKQNTLLNQQSMTIGVKTESLLYTDLSGGAGFGFTDSRTGMPKEERTYDENGAMRSRTLTDWIYKGTTGANRDARVKRSLSIIIEGGQALANLSENEYDENGSSDAGHFSHLNVERTRGYHFAVLDSNTAQTGSFPTIAGYFNQNLLANVAEIDYLYSSSYKERGISSLPTESRVLDKDGNLVAKTQTIFDETEYLAANSGILRGNLESTWVNPNTTYRAKPTTAGTWDKDTNSWIQTHTQYDQYGNVRKVWDVSGDPSRYAETFYDDPSNYTCGGELCPQTYVYPTKIITPAPDSSNTGHGATQTSTTETAYDFTTGLVLKVKDDFGQETQAEYDSMLRPSRISGVGSFVIPVNEAIYDDTNLTVKMRRQLDEANWDESTTYMDSAGRIVRSQTKDSQGDVFVDMEYDNLGRKKRVSNPYRQGTQNSEKLWSGNSYDELGRLKETFAPPIELNGAPQSLGNTEYSISTAPGFVGAVVTSTDASGRKSRTITNALGQLIRADESSSTNTLEPIPPGAPNPNPNPSPTPPGGSGNGGCYGSAAPGCLTNGANDYPMQSSYYFYNTQGEMVRVQQGGQNRYFLYDSLGRLIRVRQPEQEVNSSLNTTESIYGNTQWTAAFSYDVFGNIIKTTDADGVNIINEYDKASRIIRRCYTKPNISPVNLPAVCSQLSGSQISDDTPPVEYFYDGKGLAQQQSPNYAKGKLTKVYSIVSETKYTEFDNFGRLKQSQQITGGQTHTSSFQYNLSGALIQQTYPSGRTVKNELETDGDLSRISGKANSNATERTYASGFSYTPDGRVQRLRLGNGRWESAKFNNRRQVTELALGTSDGDGTLWKQNYEYGETETNGTVNLSKNTGNIARQTLSFNGLAQPFVQTFKYDSLYRLIEAKETNNNQQTWKQLFAYDRFGNRTGHDKFIGTTQITQNSITHPQIDAATNRFSANQGYIYDKNGNQTQDPTNNGRQFIFNGENKQTQVKDANGNTIGTYFYDGEGKRVKKITNQETTIFVYDGIGKLIAEYSTQTPPQNPTTSYTITDQLDSPRVITNSLGDVISRRDFMPFGEELGPDGQYRTTNQKYNTGDNIRQRFTGYQKDTETELDFAEARMYENRHARFTAVDPLLASGRSANPQTFNRYVYVRNSPLISTDPSGLCGASINGKKERECPLNYSGPVYTNGYRYSDVQYDDTWTRFTGEKTITRDDNGYRTRINESGWHQVNLRILFLTNDFPANPYEQAIGGFFEGIGNFGKTFGNIGAELAWNYRTGGFTPYPVFFPRTECSSRIGCSWSGGSENTASIAPFVAAAPFAVSTSLSIVSRSAVSNRAFFSGANMEVRAIDEGLQTLGQTRAGQNLQRLIKSKNISWERAETMWERLSVAWAKGVPDGNSVNVFLNNPRPQSIWLRIEEPALVEKGIFIIRRKQ